MPATVEIDPIRRLVIIRVSGPLTLDDMASTRQHLKSNPAFDPTFDQVNDLRATSTVAMTGDQLRQAAGQSVFDRRSRVAIVVTRDNPGTYGMVRMYELRRTADDPNRVGIFDTMEEAVEWLAPRP